MLTVVSGTILLTIVVVAFILALARAATDWICGWLP